MARDPRYDILFEPVQIGPVTARNRFYQVPHCCGMGFNWPQTHAKMREAKAEGGWAVVCTEECMIHPSSDYSPEPQARLWDDRDVEYLALMVEAVHRHGALAGVQLAHNGVGVQNHFTRLPPIGPSGQSAVIGVPSQTRGMNRHDIREFRRWHRKAAVRAKRADAEILYGYAGHDTALLMHFLSARRNQRMDEYGGKLENRVRLFREVLEETKDTVGDRCAVAVRLAVDELIGPEGITAAGEGGRSSKCLRSYRIYGMSTSVIGPTIRSLLASVMRAIRSRTSSSSRRLRPSLSLVWVGSPHRMPWSARSSEAYWT